MARSRERTVRAGKRSRLLRRFLLAVATTSLLASVGARLPRRQAQADEAGLTPTPPPTGVTAEPTRTGSPTPATPSLMPTSDFVPTSTGVAAEPTRSAEHSPTAEPIYHMIKVGETLTSIARVHGAAVAELARLNELTDPNRIYAGQRLVIPDRIDSSGLQPAPTPDPSLASPDEMLKGGWIDVDLSEQRLTAYEVSTPVRTTLVSTGLPSTPTPVGQFRIWIKLRFDDMAGADYYIEDVPYVMYFHEGYGLHGVTWHGNFGHPMSHGCINLPTSEAAWLFNWAQVGTLVNIHE